MAPATSAAWPVQRALSAVLEGDAALRSLLSGAGVYNTQTSATAKLPYVVIGDVSDTPRTLVARRGSDVACTLHIWSAEVSTRGVSLIYAELARLLHGVRIAVDGHRVQTAALALTTTFRDPSGAMHGVARYEATTLAGA